MTEWSQAVWICVSLLIGAFVVTVSVYFMNIGQQVNNEISRQEATRNMMKEYREFSGFNDKVVYAQDAVSLILQYRGTVAVRVLHGTTEAALWCSDSDIENTLKTNSRLTNSYGESVSNWSCSASGTNYTASEVYTKFNLQKVYKSVLTYGPNGEILGVTLTRGRMNGDIFVAE